MRCLTITGSTPRTNLESASESPTSTANTAATAAGCHADPAEQRQRVLQLRLDGLRRSAPPPWSSPSRRVAGSARPTGSATTARTPPGPRGRPGRPSTRWASRTPAPPRTRCPTPPTTRAPSCGYNVYTVLPTSKLSGFTQNAALESLFVGRHPRLLCEDRPRPHVRLRQPDVRRGHLRLHHHHRQQLILPAAARPMRSSTAPPFDERTPKDE